MDEKKALEELQFIKKVIDDSKRTIVDNGMGYIVWGILIVIGLASTYYGVVTQSYFDYGYNWIIVISLGWIYTFIDVRREKKTIPVYTFSAKILGSVWLSTGIALTILGFVPTFTGALHGVYVSPTMSIVLGIPFYLTGVLYDIPLIKYSSVGWWIGGTVMFIYPGLYSLILMAGMMLVLQVLPGIYLYRKFKKENVLNYE
ncbi:MAG: hypothetical protein SCALA702_15890 [Melioribacteraceae bacterium]|nr:MAG: hypothetical protein SCALA702_15890 [Melioribacteraceae bacterium]